MKQYLVLMESGQFYIFQAEDIEHAKEQAENAALTVDGDTIRVVYSLNIAWHRDTSFIPSIFAKEEKGSNKWPSLQRQLKS